MRKQLLLGVLLSAFNVAYSQYTVNLGPHLIFGALKEGTAGAGANLEVALQVSHEGGVRFLTGFTRISDKDANSKSKIDFIPVRIGYEQFLLKRFVLFGDLGVGTFLFPSYQFTDFSFGIGGGYQIPLDRNFFRLSLQYDYTNNRAATYYAWYGLRAAYGFSFKRKQ